VAFPLPRSHPLSRRSGEGEQCRSDLSYAEKRAPAPLSQGWERTSGPHTVTLQDALGRQSSVDLSVIRDTTPPTLTLEAVVQSNVLVTWSATDSGSGVDTSTCLLEVREDDGDWQAFSTDCGGDDTYDGQPGHTYTFRLSASDNVSNAASIEVEAVVPYVTKYYYANGQRVAMQKEGVVYYVHTDHLGSTSVLSDESGQPAGDRVAYLPYGGVRLGSASALPTDYTFTGQRNEAGLGLMHYGARFYSPRLGRFVSADSIVPEPGEPQTLNRYAYVQNNPVQYTDPSGHYITLYGDPGVRFAGDLSQGRRELAVRMDEGQVFVLRGGTEFVNVAEQDLANYYATGNEAYMPAAGGALEGAMGYAINDAAVASGYAARYTSLLGKLAGGYVGASFVLGAGYVPKAGSEECAGQGPPRGERLGYTETPRDAVAREAQSAYQRPHSPRLSQLEHGQAALANQRGTEQSREVQ
jgi:RHS repeat-associated protein